MMKKLKLITAITLLIALAGCSEFKDALDMRTAHDLDVGDCYNEVETLEINPGETVDADVVDATSCSEPHSHEVFSKYPSVPSAYRTLEMPIDELCFSSMGNFIRSFYPNADESRLSIIANKFDDRFTYIYYFHYVLDSTEIDLDKEITCSIMSRDSLSIGSFQSIIENW